MQLSEVVKKFLAFDLIIGIGITAITWMSLGTEGMAAKFCDLTNAERCDEVEWSEEHDPGKGRESPQSKAAVEEVQRDQTAAEKAERDYKLKYNLY